MAAVSDFRRLFCLVQTRLFSAGFAAAPCILVQYFSYLKGQDCDAPDRD